MYTLTWNNSIVFPLLIKNMFSTLQLDIRVILSAISSFYILVICQFRSMCPETQPVNCHKVDFDVVCLIFVVSAVVSNWISYCSLESYCTVTWASTEPIGYSTSGGADKTAVDSSFGFFVPTESTALGTISTLSVGVSASKPNPNLKGFKRGGSTNWSLTPTTVIDRIVDSIRLNRWFFSLISSHAFRAAAKRSETHTVS